LRFYIPTLVFFYARLLMCIIIFLCRVLSFLAVSLPRRPRRKLPLLLTKAGPGRRAMRAGQRRQPAGPRRPPHRDPPAHPLRLSGCKAVPPPRCRRQRPHTGSPPPHQWCQALRSRLAVTQRRLRRVRRRQPGDPLRRSTKRRLLRSRHRSQHHNRCRNAPRGILPGAARPGERWVCFLPQPAVSTKSPPALWTPSVSALILRTLCFYDR
jgi:hypothetical protein